MVDIFGWLAAALTLLAFSMRSMPALRVTAVGANLCFLAYGTLAELFPVLALHALLLPCNLFRLLQVSPPTAKCVGNRAAAPGRQPGLGSLRLRAAVWMFAVIVALAPQAAQAGGLAGAPSSIDDVRPRVVLQASRCMPDLLHCEDLDIPAPWFAGTSDCENFLAGFYAHAALFPYAGHDRVLLRCRFAPELTDQSGSIQRAIRGP